MNGHLAHVALPEAVYVSIIRKKIFHKKIIASLIIVLEDG